MMKEEIKNELIELAKFCSSNREATDRLIKISELINNLEQQGRTQQKIEDIELVEKYRKIISKLDRAFPWYEMKKDVNNKLKELKSQLEKERK